MAYGSILSKTSQPSNKKTYRFIVGTSTSGWTTNDCDYLCDGTADDVEINAAIQALPSTGGEIVILDGTYNITAAINVNKDNTTLSGNGSSTILKRMYKDSMIENTGLLSISSGSGCCIQNLQIDGNQSNYNGYRFYGIIVYSNNNIIKNNIIDNSNNGILLSNSDNNIVVENTCNNGNYGINLTNTNNSIIVENTCDNNTEGIYGSGNNDIIVGNICNNNSDGIYLDSSSEGNNIVNANICSNNISDGIYISNAHNNAVNGNICNNNNNNGIYIRISDNNTIIGNTCTNNGCGIRLSIGNNNNITGNTCIRGTGKSSDYTSSQYTIYFGGLSENYNLVSSNNIMGKNYISEGGTSNTFVNNKYN